MAVPGRAHDALHPQSNPGCRAGPAIEGSSVLTAISYGISIASPHSGVRKCVLTQPLSSPHTAPDGFLAFTPTPHQFDPAPVQPLIRSVHYKWRQTLPT